MVPMPEPGRLRAPATGPRRARIPDAPAPTDAASLAVHGIRPMTEITPLGDTDAAYWRMLSGAPRFRMVLTAGRPGGFRPVLPGKVTK